MNKREIQSLQPGNIIRHKKDLQWAFLVSQNFGDHLTAVRTIKLKEKDLKDWEVIIVPQNAAVLESDYETRQETKKAD